MPKMTSAQAAKELKRLNDLHTALLEKEQKAAVFTAAIQEDIEQARPEYDYAGTQVILRTFESRIIRLKHSINVFNTTYVIPEFNKTIDQMLVYIPQLTARKKNSKGWRDGCQKNDSAAAFPVPPILSSTCTAIMKYPMPSMISKKR